MPIKKTKAYIAHPFIADPEGNLKKTTEICEQIIKLFPAVVPFSPLHAFSFLGGNADQELALSLCEHLLYSCDELWVFGEWWKSSGCKREIQWARDRNIPVRIHGRFYGDWEVYEALKVGSGEASNG